MSDSSTEILSYPLRILSWIGLNPDKKTTKYYVITGIHLIIGTICFIITILQFFYAEGNIIRIAQNFEAVVAFIQLNGKILIAAIKLNNFLIMTSDAKKFWNFKECPADLREELEKTYRSTLNFQKIFVNLVYFNGALAMLGPILTKQLPTGSWFMAYDRLYIYALILQEIIVPSIATYFVGYDTLFLGFCTLLRTQFRMLNYFLRDLKVSVIFNEVDERMYFNQLASYVRYHDFLLRFSKVMRDTYSPIMLIEYSTALIVVSGYMYVLFESRNVFELVRSCILPMVNILIQLAFYCIPLNYVTDEAVSVSQGIFESDWHSQHIPGLKNVLPLIIQRSQAEIIFRAGNLVEMNCRTLLNILRRSYSACTIIRALKNV